MALNRHQWNVFIGLYLGYFILYCVRKSFSYASPYIMEDEQLDKSQLGFIMSSQMVGYSISKFFGGILTDSFSPTIMFFVSLFLTGFTAVIFTFFDSVSLFALLWFLNGLSQGPSWPSCAILLKRWFPASQFGTWWSVLSSAMNLAGSIGPVTLTALVSYLGWRKTVSLTGCLSVVVSIYIVSCISDHPHYNIEEKKVKDKHKDKKFFTGSKWSMLLIFIKEPIFVGVCFNYLLISFIRGGCNDWGQLYLIQDKQLDILTGSIFISSQELGGLFGSLSAGYLSDYLISKGVQHYSARLKVTLWFTLIPVIFILILLLITSSSHELLISLTGFGIGFGLYGAMVLFGVTAMESAPSGLEGTAHSIAALTANIGIVLSGYPLSLIAKSYNWPAAFQLILVTSILSVLIAFYCQMSTPKVSKH